MPDQIRVKIVANIRTRRSARDVQADVQAALSSLRQRIQDALVADDPSAAVAWGKERVKVDSFAGNVLSIYPKLPVTVTSSRTGDQTFAVLKSAAVSMKTVVENALRPQDTLLGWDGP